MPDGLITTAATLTGPQFGLMLLQGVHFDAPVLTGPQAGPLALGE